MNFWRIVALILCLGTVLTASCASLDNAATENGGVGTTVNKPKPATLTLFPDFEEAFPDTTLGDASVSEMNYLTTGTITEVEEDPDPDAYINQVWNNLFVNGPVLEARLLRGQLATFGAIVSREASDAGLATISTQTQSVTLSTALSLADWPSIWTVEIKLEDSDPNYTRYYFRNDAGFLQASYIVAHDENQNPVRGLFAYVNPARLNGEDLNAKEFILLAYDITDAQNHLFSLSEIDYLFLEDTDLIYRFLEECDTLTGPCQGQYIDANNHWLFSANEQTNAVCLKAVSGTTYAFTGPSAPADNQVSVDTCTVANTTLTDNVFSETDLPQGYDDTNPLSSDALEFYSDGVSKEGWDTLTPEAIDYYF